jgi:glycine/sarcosine N-methyltransferase
MRQVPLYDALAGDRDRGDYDHFVDWKGRLAHELPFFDRLFTEHGVHRILDAACGTGHHAIALAQRGYQVAGADLSSAMVERARENAAAANVDAAFHVAGFGQLADLGQGFEAMICVGNSLPHLLSAPALDAALRDFGAALQPGGLLIIQNRNFDRVLVERERFMPPQSHREGEREWLFLRFYDFHETTITFNMMRLWKTEEGWEQDVNSTELRPILSDELAAALDAAGFQDVEFFGGYDGSDFDPAHSGDLIAVIRKA